VAIGISWAEVMCIASFIQRFASNNPGPAGAPERGLASLAVAERSPRQDQRPPAEQAINLVKLSERTVPLMRASLSFRAQKLAGFAVDEMQPGASWADGPLILVFGNI
jgi:hypothetical protein